MALYFSPTAAEHRNTLSVTALEMAQRIGDPRTLALTLLARHFVLWGLGSVEERLALATEVIRLAQAAGDVGTTLEGRSWRILALFEQGDITAMDREIDHYTRQSAKLRLPRNQWYLTLVRSARAFLVGQFVEGEQLATQAASVQGEASDQANAVMFFGAQLFTLRREQGRMAELEPALIGFAQQFAALPIWRCSVTAFHCEMGNHEAARREFDALAEHDFAALPHDANRPSSLALLSEACNMLGDAQRAEQLYQFMFPYAERNIVVATSALAYGPAARYLGLLATTMGRWEDARRHFADALTMSEKMDARPWIAHTHHDHAQMLLTRNHAGDAEHAMRLLNLALTVAQELGMKDLEDKITRLRTSSQYSIVGSQHEERTLQISLPNTQHLTPRTQPLTSNLFRREGDYWTITYQDNTIRLKDLRGLHYLAFLLRHPHQEFHALELATLQTGGLPEDGQPTPSRVSIASDAGEMLDAKARTAYRQRLTELRADLEEAQTLNDLGRADKAKQEIDFLTEELARAFGLHGRSRKVAAQTERARVSVTRRIIVARQKIAALNPALDRYLGLTIKTGVFCSYVPHPDFPVDWQF
jgi:tetratricopeptide (TPR) repeat protein